MINSTHIAHRVRFLIRQRVSAERIFLIGTAKDCTRYAERGHQRPSVTQWDRIAEHRYAVGLVLQGQRALHAVNIYRVEGNAEAHSPGQKVGLWRLYSHDCLGLRGRRRYVAAYRRDVCLCRRHGRHGAYKQCGECVSGQAQNIVSIFHNCQIHKASNILRVYSLSAETIEMK